MDEKSVLANKTLLVSMNEVVKRLANTDAANKVWNNVVPETFDSDYIDTVASDSESIDYICATFFDTIEACCDAGFASVANDIPGASDAFGLRR